MPVPARHPDIVARVGIDLNPLDVTNAEDMSWLRALIWPEHQLRRDRLAAGIRAARTAPPQMLAGDMLERLDEALTLAVASGGAPVVHHSAAVAYLDPDSRDRLELRMRDLVRTGRCHWISLEGPRVLPSLATSALHRPDSEHQFCLAVDGQAVAWAQGTAPTCAGSRK